MSLTSTRVPERAVLAACVALYLGLAGVRAWDHTHPYYDDVGFLDLGNQAREIGGPLGLARALYQGRWLEANRNPLYVGVLSLVAGRDHGYHTRARVLTILLGLAALLAWWRTVRRHFGARAALLVAAFLAVSECFIDYSARESAEPLLLLLWALGVGAILDGVERPARWVAAGAWAGLAQLDKGSGIFLVFCLGVALLIWRGPRALRDRWAWGTGLAFVAVASPLLVRNLRVYGSPLHHWNNRLFWIDRLPDYAEIYAPSGLDRLPQGFHQWAASTNWHEIWFGRVFMGFAETAVHIGDAMSFVAPSPLGPVHLPGVVLGFALFVLSLRLLWTSERSFVRTFLLVQTAFFVAFFIFFSVTGGSSRYLFPMTLCLYAVLASELVERPLWLRRWAMAAAVCVALALALDPFPRRPLPGYDEAGAWLQRNLRPGEAYAVDSRSQFEPEWFLPASSPMEIVSSAWARQPVPSSELLAWFLDHGVRYAVRDLTSHKDGEPRYFFYDQPQVPPWARIAFSAGPLQILEVSPGSAARAEARAR